VSFEELRDLKKKKKKRADLEDMAMTYINIKSISICSERQADADGGLLGVKAGLECEN
jgi:hypothetical protein